MGMPNDLKRVSPGVYGMKQSVLTQSPMSSPKKCRRESTKRSKSPSKTIGLSNGRNLEIVSDSSNDAFTYLCCHPEVRSTVDSTKNTTSFSNIQTNTSATISKVAGVLNGTSDDTNVHSRHSDSLVITSNVPPPISDATPKIPSPSPDLSIPTDQHSSVPSDSRELPQTQLLRCGDFVISDYIIITSSLSSSNMDRIRAFASRASILWMQDFPHETSLVDASNPSELPPNVTIPARQPMRGKNRRKRAQRFILVIRAKDGWCKRTVKYLYGLAQ